jgi:dihydropteroate synthase
VFDKTIDLNCYVSNQSSFSMILVVAMEYAIPSIVLTNQNKHTNSYIVTSLITRIFKTIELDLENFVAKFLNPLLGFKNMSIGFGKKKLDLKKLVTNVAQNNLNFTTHPNITI